MPTFEITNPQGQKYRIDGPEGATEQQAAQMLQRKLVGMPAPAPAASFNERFKGATAAAEPGPQAPSFLKHPIDRLAFEAKGIPAGLARGLAGTARASGEGAQIEMGQPVDVPTAEEGKQLIEKNVTGTLPKGGRFGEALGEAAANPTTYLGPGGPAKNLAAGALAGLTSEVAGQATEGTKAEPYARFMGAAFPFGRWRTPQAKAASAAPLAEELFDAGRHQYQQIRALDLRIKPEPINKLATGIATDLTDRGLTKTNVPETYAVIERLQKPAPAGGFVKATDFDAARQELLQAAKSIANPREKAAAWPAIEQLDKYLSNLPQDHVIRGDAPTAAKLFGQARGNWAAAKRLEMLGGKLELGDLNAATAHSGMNRDNAIRQAVKQLIRPNKYGKTLAEQHGFSPREIAAMNEIARGSAPINTLRYIGNLLGGGGGLGQLAVAGAGAGLGYETGHPELIGLGLLGLSARRGASALTERRAQRLVEDVARRSPAATGGTVATPRSSQFGPLVGSSGVRGLTYGGPQ